MLKLRFFKVKPDKVDRLRDWMSELTRRKDEALATLKQETVTRECGFLIDTSGDQY